MVVCQIGVTSCHLVFIPSLTSKRKTPGYYCSQINLHKIPLNPKKYFTEEKKQARRSIDNGRLKWGFVPYYWCLC